VRRARFAPIRKKPAGFWVGAQLQFVSTLATTSTLVIYDPITTDLGDEKRLVHRRTIIQFMHRSGTAGSAVWASSLQLRRTDEALVLAAPLDPLSNDQDYFNKGMQTLWMHRFMSNPNTLDILVQDFEVRTKRKLDAAQEALTLVTHCTSNVDTPVINVLVRSYFTKG